MASQLYVLKRSDSSLIILVVNNDRKTCTAYNWADKQNPVIWQRPILYADATTVILANNGQVCNSLRYVGGQFVERYLDNNTMNNIFLLVTKADLDYVNLSLSNEDAWYATLKEQAQSGVVND
jgi:hypothetical protein